METKKASCDKISQRRLKDLESVGQETLEDFKKLGIKTVEALAKQDPVQLYDDLRAITKQRHDICALDVFSCAVAQSRDPKLPKEMRKWWYWSRKRKALLNFGKTK